ncbi:hypothetical protein HOLleu_10327 [Holothuria leucospilota]|uniref:Uncharacterized protein n=1 Tax=Holothuria leucospilota TaxID=206669 RepID=A0A9Q1CE65_HOLLE|nr:hypothetical protein HOLleu_10327 [Holothuria leucospilota]
MPIGSAIIVGLVHMAGFGSGGIAAGSFAAGMMSSAAPVAAGSMVAVLQSIGATGVVSGTTALIANTTVGAAVGGGALKAWRLYGHRLPALKSKF